MAKQRNCWKLNEETLVLTLCNKRGNWLYDLGLEEFTTSARVLDAIMQVASKTWATAEMVSDLVWAINEVLRPQQTLCSMGAERGPLQDVRGTLQCLRELDAMVRPVADRMDINADQSEGSEAPAAAYYCRKCGSVELGEPSEAEFECGWCGGTVVCVQIGELVRMWDARALMARALKLGAAHGQGMVREACAEACGQMGLLQKEVDDVEI